MIKREYEKGGTAPVPYIITERQGVYRMKYYAMISPIVTNDIGKIQVHYNGTEYKFDASSSGTNWAKAHYTEGAELIDQVVDCSQGFQITLSIGGGTGAGLLSMKIRDTPDTITATISVSLSPKVSDVVEPHNVTLSIHQSVENSYETFVIDNEPLCNISHNISKQPQPKYAKLNWITSLAINVIGASLRFNGKLNGDLLNLVPFPLLHFLPIAQAPLFALHVLMPNM